MRGGLGVAGRGWGPAGGGGRRYQSRRGVVGVTLDQHCFQTLQSSAIRPDNVPGRTWRHALKGLTSHLVYISRALFSAKKDFIYFSDVASSWRALEREEYYNSCILRSAGSEFLATSTSNSNTALNLQVQNFTRS